MTDLTQRLEAEKVETVYWNPTWLTVHKIEIIGEPDDPEAITKLKELEAVRDRIVHNIGSIVAQFPKSLHYDDGSMTGRSVQICSGDPPKMPP